MGSKLPFSRIESCFNKELNYNRNFRLSNRSFQLYNQNFQLYNRKFRLKIGRGGKVLFISKKESLYLVESNYSCLEL